MKIGQISFIRMTTPAEHPYGSAEVGSKYQGQVGPRPEPVLGELPVAARRRLLRQVGERLGQPGLAGHEQGVAGPEAGVGGGVGERATGGLDAHHGEPVAAAERHLGERLADELGRRAWSRRGRSRGRARGTR